MVIKDIKRTKPRKVYAIQTSSGTFIADGLAHHNCQGCNLWGGGRIQNIYTLFIIEKFGLGFFEEKVKLSHTAVKHTEEDWRELRDLYRDKHEALKKG